MLQAVIDTVTDGTCVVLNYCVFFPSKAFQDILYSFNINYCGVGVAMGWVFGRDCEHSMPFKFYVHAFDDGL